MRTRERGERVREAREEEGRAEGEGCLHFTSHYIIPYCHITNQCG